MEPDSQNPASVRKPSADAGPAAGAFADAVASGGSISAIEGEGAKGYFERHTEFEPTFSEIEREGLLPIVIGIVAHRDTLPEQHEGLRQSLLSVLDSLRSEYSHTPFIILNSLAEGGDRLTAHTSLDWGARMIAVLPMASEEYEKDFCDPASLTEFRQLRARAEHTIELPTDKRGIGASASSAELRNLQYEQAAAFLVQNSHVLIALWDGLVIHLPGGTSHAVEFALRGVPEPFAPHRHPLDPSEGGPVYQIVTQRSSRKPTEYPAFSIRKLYPSNYTSDIEAAKHFHSLFERMEKFNEDVSRHSAALTEEIKKSKEYLLPKGVRKSLAQPLQVIIHYFAVADALSGFYRRKSQNFLRALFIVVFGALTVFNVFSHLSHETKALLAGYLVIISGVYLWYRFAERREVYNKYLDYRALAEGLRVQLFWRLSGIREQAADYYLRKQKGELDWIRYAMRLTAILNERHVHANVDHIHVPHPTGVGHAMKHWVTDQADYFASAFRRDSKRLLNLEHFVSGFFALGIVLALIQLFIPTIPFLVFLIETAAVIAALLHNYMEKNLLREHVKQYERMALLYKLAKDHFGALLKKEDFAAAQQFAREIGKEALMENADWILVHRLNPIEVPK